MAKFELVFKPSVSKDLKDISNKDVGRIMEKIASLRENPRPQGSVKLSGREYYRVRQGDYRIVYEIVESRLIVVVIKVGHRREVYR